jgi:hypothetical protein
MADALNELYKLAKRDSLLVTIILDNYYKGVAVLEV